MTKLVQKVGLSHLKILNMAKGVAYSQDLRQNIVQQYLRGQSMKKISVTMNMPKSSVAYILKTFRETGSTKNRGKSSGRPKIITERDRRALVKICKSQRRATLRAITSQWNTEMGLKVSRECCRKWIHKSGLHFYKVGPDCHN